jgi:hypothetical protein
LRVLVRPVCDYCPNPADRYVRGGDETPLCTNTGRDHYGSVRRMREATGELGVTRLTVVDRVEWAPVV